MKGAYPHDPCGCPSGIVFFRFHGDELPVVESGRNGTPLQVRLKDWLTWGEEVERDGQSIIRAKVNPGLCVGCGACVAVCPTRAIDLQGWTLDPFEAMIDGFLSPPTAVGAPPPEIAFHGHNH